MTPQAPSPTDFLYEYPVPAGYGDTFFIYAFNGDTLTAGLNYFQQKINIQDGDFVARYWAGLGSVATKIMLYDRLMRRTMSDYATVYSSLNPTGTLLLPELLYPVNNAIRFDLISAAPTAVSGGVFISQLVFAGVRRRLAHYSDPEPSAYPYYEKPYALNTPGNTGTYILSINNYGAVGGVVQPPVQYVIGIKDFDFELHRCELQLQSAQQASQFAITLYDSYGNATSNVPILANRFFHLNPTQSSGELNFFPSPPILYKTDSFLRFDIWSKLMPPTALPQAFNILFHGVRRIPCR